MIEPGKLFQLEGGQKRRKLALTFGALERDIQGIAEKGTEYNFTSMTRQDYVREITKVLLKDPKLPSDAAEELKRLLAAEPFDELRLCNCARNHLLTLIGHILPPGCNPPMTCIPVSKCSPKRWKVCRPPPITAFFSNMVTSKPSLLRIAPVKRPPRPAPMIIIFCFICYWP